MKKITFVVAFLILLSCNSKKEDKSQIQTFARLLPSVPNGYSFKDTVNGYEVNWYIRDTSITVNIPYTSTKTLVDSTMRWLGVLTPPPVDTIVIPPVTSMAIQGYGADAIGGLLFPNSVYHVTNTNASGAGSLANGIGSNKNIVFDVSGTINTRLYVSGLSYLTIDAYSSKQDITISTNNGDALTVENSHHIIIRGVRFTCSVPGNDGLNATGTSHDVTFDHCTSFGNADGNIDLAATGGKNFTVQWCMMYGNKGSGNMLITTQNASVHHNLFIGNKGSVPDWEERNPYSHSNYSPKGTVTSPNFDFRNNLIQASGRYASGNGYGAVGNYINNYYTSNKAGLINLCADAISCGTAYVFGNFNQPTASGGTKVATEYQIPIKYQIATTDAKTAAQAIKQNVGTYKRTVDEQNLVNAINVQ